ncbi:MAG TPA: magnesium-translocating P-type ATPase [Myxococcales bacterium]|nr:magnesium-translocating P-type ATPase [Myxococcales bacterium]
MIRRANSETASAPPKQPSPRSFWTGPGEPLLRDLEVTPSGLTSAEAAIRLARYGPNTPVPARRATALRLLLSQFTAPITLLLLAAAVLSMVVGERTDGAVILGILVVSGLLGFWQENRAANAVSRLLKLVQTTAAVLRDGREQAVPLVDVVPGDVVVLRAGASVPGDARLLDAKDLFVDQATLTGESYPAEKDVTPAAADAPLADRRNAVFLGTHVVSGMARALVVRTGAATEFGALAQRLAARPPETEFERGVRQFGGLLIEVSLVLSIVIFAVNVALHRPVLDALLFTLALVVGMTPQLLPAIVSVTLAQGARHMADQKVIVRRLAAIEDLGGMQVLCTDKTGTITEGVVAIHAAEDWTGAPSDEVLREACLNARFASGYVNPIDEALRTASVAGVDAWIKFDEVPYDFVRKRLSVAVKSGEQRLLITKGALTNVLEACEAARSAAGVSRPLDVVRGAIEARYEALSRGGFRCLGVACKALASAAPVTRADERGLTFLGILSFADPLKPGAAAALGELGRLGVDVKVISGDNRHVVARVAAEAGLAGSALLTGGELRSMSDEALAGAAPRTDLFAEVEPNQKERIIRALRKGGRSVGYLGDGINDAAALRAGDVGISVDSATDVTKEAADVVLLDKDLGVLARGVREGRRAFANTLKYVFITTSANFGNMLSMAIASCFAAFLPMLPKQVLLLNVLTDLPSMAIATDRLDPELVAEPRRWRTDQIRRFMIVFGAVSSVFDMITFGVLIWLGVSAEIFRTAWFLESALSELLVLLVVRTRRVFFRSPVGGPLLVATVAVSALVLALPYLPLAQTLGFTALPASIAWLVLGIVIAYVATAEVVKRAVRGRGIAL